MPESTRANKRVLKPAVHIVLLPVRRPEVVIDHLNPHNCQRQTPLNGGLLFCLPGRIFFSTACSLQKTAVIKDGEKNKKSVNRFNLYLLLWKLATRFFTLYMKL